MSTNHHDEASDVIRIHRNTHMFAVSDEGANDTRLSWLARGILFYLETKPEGWGIETDDLVRRGDTDHATTTAALQELADLGYVPQNWDA